MTNSTRVCTNCKSTGPFFSCNKVKDGLRNICKKCVIEQQRARRMTPYGRALMMWNGIVARAGKQKYYLTVRIECTKGEFMAWAIPRLYLWFKKNPGVPPSIDRCKSTEHYTLSNLRITSRGENTRNREHSRYTRAPKGAAWCGRCKQYLPKSDFSPKPTRPSGVQGHCKKCFAVYMKNRRDELGRPSQAKIK